MASTELVRRLLALFLTVFQKSCTRSHRLLEVRSGVRRKSVPRFLRALLVGVDQRATIVVMKDGGMTLHHLPMSIHHHRPGLITGVPCPGQLIPELLKLNGHIGEGETLWIHCVIRNSGTVGGRNDGVDHG